MTTIAFLRKRLQKTNPNVLATATRHVTTTELGWWDFSPIRTDRGIVVPSDFTKWESLEDLTIVEKFSNLDLTTMRRAACTRCDDELDLLFVRSLIRQHLKGA